MQLKYRNIYKTQLMIKSGHKFHQLGSYNGNSNDLILYLPGTNPNDQELFCKQLKADMFLTIRCTNSIFPIHSFRARNYSGLLRNCNNERNIIIEENFKEEDLSKILSLFYGFRVKLDRANVPPYYHILAYLQVDLLLRLIQTDILTNFSQYDLFVVLQLSCHYHLNDIIEQCFRQLLNQQFQQMQYNLFDLLRCSEEVFRLVIINHNQIKGQGKIKGFTWEQIQQIIKQYSDTNKLTTMKTATLLRDLLDPKELLKERKKINQDRIGLLYNHQMKGKQLSNHKNKPLNSTKKMSQSFLGEKTLNTPHTIIARNHTSFSNIFFKNSPQLQSTKSSNIPIFIKKITKNNDEKNYDNQNKEFLKQNISETEYKNGFKLVVNPQFEQLPRALSRQIQSKMQCQTRRSVFLPNQNIAQKMVPQTANNKEINNNYLTVGNYGPTSPKSHERSSSKFKVWENQPRKSTTKVNLKVPKEPLSESENGKNINFNDLTQNRKIINLKVPVSMKQIKQIQQINQMQNLQGNQEIKIGSTPNISFGQLISPNVMGVVQNIDKIYDKQRTRRLTSFENRQHTSPQIAFEEGYERYKRQFRQKSQVLREIQDLNNQSQKITENSKLMMEEVKRIKDQFTKKESANKLYKQNLCHIQNMLKKLEKDFGQKNSVISKLEERVQSISKSIKLKELN